MVVLSEVAVDIVAVEDEARFRDLMQAHHYLGAVPGMGETVRYVAHHRGRWLALAVFSAPALKCGARDRWIGWDYGVQFGRLHLVTNNSRFLILPGGERNLGSRVLSLCARRLVNDWPARFGRFISELLLVGLARNGWRDPKGTSVRTPGNRSGRGTVGFQSCHQEHEANFKNLLKSYVEH